MRSHFVVLGSPFFDLFTGVVQIQEPVPAETFQSHGGVEALHISIVGRLAWAAEVERDAVRISPLLPVPVTSLSAICGMIIDPLLPVPVMSLRVDGSDNDTSRDMPEWLGRPCGSTLQTHHAQSQSYRVPEQAS